MHLHQILSRKWQKCVGTRRFQGGLEEVRRWGRNSLFYSFSLWSLTMLVYLSTKINGLEQSHSKAFIVNQRKRGIGMIWCFWTEMTWGERKRAFGNFLRWPKNEVQFQTRNFLYSLRENASHFYDWKTSKLPKKDNSILPKKLCWLFIYVAMLQLQISCIGTC